MFDPTLPRELKDLQIWFAEAITTPFKDNQLAASPALQQEIDQKICPSPTLKPFQRIELYHQQYWWRLLRALQGNFPTLTRLFGYEDFNALIGVPYLTAHPAAHWAMIRLGETLPQWIHEAYSGEDKKIVFEASLIDAAFESAFWQEHAPAVDFSTLSPEEMTTTSFALQPHVHLFAFSSNLFAFREEFLLQPIEHWYNHPFPKLTTKPCYFILYRTLHNRVIWKEIKESAFTLLVHLNSGLTINAACEKIEEQGGELYEEAESELPFWFHEWTSSELLTLKAY